MAARLRNAMRRDLRGVHRKQPVRRRRCAVPPRTAGAAPQERAWSRCGI